MKLESLLNLLENGGTITIEAIDKLAIPQIDGIIFNLIDELGMKNIEKAMLTLHNLLYQREPIQMILIMLYRHFKKLYLVKLANREGKNLQDVLELKPNQMFLVSKYKRQAGYFKTKELRNILKELIELDKNYKSGIIDINVGLDSILCAYF